VNQPTHPHPPPFAPTQDEWNDKNTGEKRSAVKVVAKQVGVLPRRGASPQPQGDYGNSNGGAAAAAPYQPAPQAAQPPPQQQQWEPQQPAQQQWDPQPPQQPQQQPQWEQPQPQQQQQQWDQQQAVAPAPWDQQQPPQQQPAYYAQQAPEAAAPYAPPPPQQQPPPAPPAFVADRFQLPAAPANAVEEKWLSVINSPNDWWDNRTVSGGASVIVLLALDGACRQPPPRSVCSTDLNRPHRLAPGDLAHSSFLLNARAPSHLTASLSHPPPPRPPRTSATPAPRTSSGRRATTRCGSRGATRRPGWPQTCRPPSPGSDRKAAEWMV
jgi:hypothetical protein